MVKITVRNRKKISTPTVREGLEKSTMRQRMRAHFKKILTLILAAAFSYMQTAPLVFAQSAEHSNSEPVQSELTLPLAVDIALRTNPLVRATASGREMADAQLDEARAGRYPFLQLSETVTRSNNPVFVFGSLLEQGRFGQENFDLSSLNNPSSLNNFRTALTFRIPVFDQRQTRTRINEAELGRRQADAQDELVRQRVRFEVLRAYYGLLVAQAKKGVSDEAVRMAESDVKRIRDMFETGMVVESDLLALEVQLAEFRQQQIQAEGDLITSRAALNTALGIAIDTPQKIAGGLVEKTFDAVSQEELISLALHHRPEFAQARFNLQSAKERVRGARGQFLPRVDVFGGFGISSNGFANGSSDYTVGASVTFNLFDAGRSARLNQARVAEAMVSAEQEDLANRIRMEAVRAYQQYVSARERVALAARVVDQAKEALRIIRDRYQAGLTTITEVLRAETTFVRARTMLLAARHDHYVGYAGVLLASGRLTDVQPFVS
ncbi:MAG: TolC family protein [Blastocatellia bacterium]|nr:TolC family protein [Blastocatellia bacterium]